MSSSRLWASPAYCTCTAAAVLAGLGGGGVLTKSYAIVPDGEPAHYPGGRTRRWGALVPGMRAADPSRAVTPPVLSTDTCNKPEAGVNQPPWAAEIIRLVDGGHLDQANRLIDTVVECGTDAVTVQLARAAHHLLEFLVADAADGQARPPDAVIRTAPHSESIRAAIHALLSSDFDRPPKSPAAMPARGQRDCVTLRDPGDAQLAVRVLGPFEVRVCGVPVVRWASRRGQSVLGFLVLHRDLPMLRERLMDLLWPSARPEAARNSLNVAVHGLRRSLCAVDPAGVAGDYVVYREECYQLSPRLSVWVDAEEFTQHHRNGIAARRSGNHACAIAHFDAAVSLYRGELFENDTTGDWYVERQRRFQELYCDILEELAELRLANGGGDDAVAACHRILDLDSCRERAHRLLMRAYLGRGQRHRVLRQYTECARCCATNSASDPTPRQPPCSGSFSTTREALFGICRVLRRRADGDIKCCLSAE